MAKKTKSSTVKSSEAVVDAPGEGEATMYLGQTAENNVHAKEEVLVAEDKPTVHGTRVDEATADPGKKTELKSNKPTTSPYACSPVAIDVGPGLATYWVPKHLLRSPKWSTTDAGGMICLPGVSAATGHTLVHYLYMGTYQTLEAEVEDSETQVHIKFRHALLTFILASNYELPDLERLAQEQIKKYGRDMALVEILDTVRKEFSKMTWCWFHEYLQARAKEQFEHDYTVFTSKVFVESVGKGTLHRFMMYHLLEIFSDKLTHTLQTRESHCRDTDEPDQVLNEAADVGSPAVQIYHCPDRHETGTPTTGDEISFEFPNASCEDVDDVISLEDSSVRNCAVSESPIEEVPHQEVRDIHEDPGMEESGPAQVCEEPYEPTHANEAGNQASPAPKSESREQQEEESTWGFTGKKMTAKRMKKLQREQQRKEEEAAAAAAAAEEEMLRVKEEEDDWGFSFGSTTKDRKKKKKGLVEEPPPESEQPAEPELAPEPVLEPEPIKEEDPWGFTAFTITKKNQEEPKIEEPLPWPPEPEPEPEKEPEPVPEEPESIPESTTETSSTLCPRRSHHLLKGDRWKSCERCRAMLRGIAVQLAKENEGVLLLAD